MTWGQVVIVCVTLFLASVAVGAGLSSVADRMKAIGDEIEKLRHTVDKK